jgi:anthranilate phosphoribosyltransferase
VIASALGRLGVRKAWVVRSEDGLDEISPASSTRVTVVDDGRIEERVVHPEDFGAKAVSLDSLRGGDAKENADVMLRIFRREEHPARTAVLLNAAAALALVRGNDLKAAYEEAAAAIDAGHAHATVDAWRRLALAAREASA